MRKLLFVHEERYLESALRNVTDLFGFEERLSASNSVSDLLAVLLMSPQVVSKLLTCEQQCDLQRFDDRTSLFGPDAISLNGRWILVTLGRQDFQEPSDRHEVLDRVLNILRSQGFVRDSGTVFPVSTFKSSYMLIRESMSILRSGQSRN